jgi:hypothetical protein
MDCKILKSNNITIDNILFKKRISVGTKIFKYPIKYLGEDLIIQTPILYLPFGMYTCGNKSYINASFLNVSVDKDMAEYKYIIKQLNNKVIKFISNIYKKDNLSFVDSIKQSTELYPDRMRFNLQEDILIFSDKKKLLDFEYLKAKSYTKFLVSPVNIWLNETKYGITWQILQIKIYPQTILNTYSFIDEDSDGKQITNVNKYKSHPQYQKYFKMLSCGVPKDAVKHKMIVDNLDPNVLDIDNSSNTSLNNTSLNNTSLNNTSLNSKDKLNNSLENLLSKKSDPQKTINIMEQIKLAKCQKQDKNKKILSNVKQIVGYKAPSITEILDMRNKLNKIN